MYRRRYITPIAKHIDIEAETTLFAGSPQTLNINEEETTDAWSNKRTPSECIWND